MCRGLGSLVCLDPDAADLWRKPSVSSLPGLWLWSPTTYTHTQIHTPHTDMHPQTCILDMGREAWWADKLVIKFSSKLSSVIKKGRERFCGSMFVICRRLQRVAPRWGSICRGQAARLLVLQARLSHGFDASTGFLGLLEWMTTVYFLTVLQAGNPRSRCQWGWVARRTFPSRRACACCPFTLQSLCVYRWLLMSVFWSLLLLRHQLVWTKAHKQG